MVGSENTNAAENDRINRNLLILRQTTEKEKKGLSETSSILPFLLKMNVMQQTS